MNRLSQTSLGMNKIRFIKNFIVFLLLLCVMPKKTLTRDKITAFTHNLLCLIALFVLLCLIDVIFKIQQSVTLFHMSVRVWTSIRYQSIRRTMTSERSSEEQSADFPSSDDMEMLSHSISGESEMIRGKHTSLLSPLYLFIGYILPMKFRVRSVSMDDVKCREALRVFYSNAVFKLCSTEGFFLILSMIHH